MRELFYNLDLIKIGKERIYFHGWVFHRNERIKSIKALINLDKKLNEFDVNYGTPRPDVYQHFMCENSKNCGFWFVRHFPSRISRKVIIKLKIVFENLNEYIITIEFPRNEGITKKFKKVVRLLLKGDLRGLLIKINRIRKGKGSRGSDKNLFSYQLFTNKIGGAKELPFSLIVDHNMGGGANAYREILIQDISVKSPVLLVYYDVSSMSHFLKFIYRGFSETFLLRSFFDISKLFNLIDIKDVILNNLVSYEDPLSIVRFLEILKREKGFKLIIPIHDYFCVCPSYTLLNFEGVFCGIPSIDCCKICLPKNCGEFRFFSAHENINVWRDIWGALLARADCILCFSPSSIDYILRAYPRISRSKIILKPHKINFSSTKKPLIKHKKDLHIGVVGNISIPKGAGIVREMVELIEKKGLNIKVTVVGTLENPPISRVLKITGPYERSDLAEIIEKSGINVCLIPSICPETFCFVLHELIELDMPVAAFSLGAQRDRIEKYNKGVIIQKVDPEYALNVLIRFHKQIYSQTS